MEIMDPDQWELLRLSIINPVTITGLVIVILMSYLLTLAINEYLIFLYSIGFTTFIFGVTLGYSNKSMKDQKTFKKELYDYLKKINHITINESHNLGLYQKENDKIENCQLILKLYHTRNNQLATYIHLSTAGIWGFLGILLLETMRSNPSAISLIIFLLITIFAMIIWRFYSLYIDYDILNCYEKILNCECALNIDYNVSLLSSLIKDVPNFPTGRDKVDEYKSMLDLVKNKKIPRPCHRFFDLIAGLIVIVSLTSILFLIR